MTFFDVRGWEVHGVENNMRTDFFSISTNQILEELVGASTERMPSRQRVDRSHSSPPCP